MPSYSKEVKLPGKSAAQLYEAVDAGIEKFMERSSPGKFEIIRNPGQKSFTLKSAMFSGELSCSEGVLKLDAKLSLMAAAFKGKIDEGIEKWIAKTFQA
jgi:hypothetical protein